MQSPTVGMPTEKAVSFQQSAVSEAESFLSLQCHENRKIPSCFALLVPCLFQSCRELWSLPSALGSVPSAYFSTTSRKAFTTHGSNWLPEDFWISAMASSVDHARL